MHYNNLMFSNAMDIDNWSLYVLRTMLWFGSVPCTISPTTTWKEYINRLVVSCKTFTISLVCDINILIVQYACMFLLPSALKGFNDIQGSKSKATAKWIPIKVSH